MLIKKSLKNYPKRGEIFVADLNPGFGLEIHKKRPILIISNDDLNQASSIVIMVPFSSIVPIFIGPDVVKIDKQKGLDLKSALIINQIRSINQARLIKKIGILSQEKIEEVEDAIKLVLSLS